MRAKLFVNLPLVFICTMAILIGSAHAEAPMNFADIPWGSSQQEVTKKFKSLGFKAGPPDKDNDIRYDGGTLIGTKAIAFAFFSDAKLAKITIALLPQNHKSISTYEEMKEILIKKYGPPDVNFEEFQSPYYKGDGYEEQAIRLGKGTFFSSWKSRVAVTINENLAVAIMYESPSWPQESDRRKSDHTKVF